ncbi:hypothetical protein MYAM1_001759 [Malassezia yamatoensis]|uniref:Inhibitor I9 domain-containing protein n=1 Tax=Malassezia yamatoensis TaxID=253288 RepID=A0AAJ5YYU4_9BASI|nr:hypothetical protein MYAM1_001759 [Malassezia yamatoensis]
MFKKSATEQDVDKYAEKLEQEGGLIQQRYNAEFLRGFTARMPQEFVEKLQDEAQNDKNGLIEAIERNQEISVQ